MKLSEAYPSKFLAASDLNGRDVTVTIESVELESIGKGSDKDDKLVITMRGKDKKFVVNKTNAKTIAKVLGSDDTDDWSGQRIIIGPREVEFQGDTVWSIRVSLRVPTSTVAAAATTATTAPTTPAPGPQAEHEEPEPEADPEEQPPF